MTGTIKLKGLEFHAFHGVYEEEQQNGNTFLVDIEIKTDVSKSSKSDNLEDTIDYVKIYEAVKTEMKVPSKLLEHVVKRINDSLLTFVQNSKIKTTVYKMNPPLEGGCKYSAITLKTQSKKSLPK